MAIKYYFVKAGGPGSSVGVATGLDGPEIESQWV